MFFEVVVDVMGGVGLQDGEDGGVVVGGEDEFDVVGHGFGQPEEGEDGVVFGVEDVVDPFDDDDNFFFLIFCVTNIFSIDKVARCFQPIVKIPS